MKILFFGRLGETIGREIDFDLPAEGCTVAQLRAALAEAHGELEAGTVRACIDREIVPESARVLPGQAVTGLFLDAYPGMTETSLEAIAADARARFAVSAVAIVHRSGAVAPGAPIVFAAAAALHRRAAFEAADYLMDRLKTDAAFWKREERADGAVWIEPRPSDRADRARWSDRCPE
jgi:molybdopterin synthase catalytic subunit